MAVLCVSRTAFRGYWLTHYSPLFYSYRIRLTVCIDDPICTRCTVLTAYGSEFGSPTRSNLSSPFSFAVSRSQITIGSKILAGAAVRIFICSFSRTFVVLGLGVFITASVHFRKKLCRTLAVASICRQQICTLPPSLPLSLCARKMGMRRHSFIFIALGLLTVRCFMAVLGRRKVDGGGAQSYGHRCVSWMWTGCF